MGGNINFEKYSFRSYIFLMKIQKNVVDNVDIVYFHFLNGFYVNPSEPGTKLCNCCHIYQILQVYRQNRTHPYKARRESNRTLLKLQLLGCVFFWG